MMEEYFDVLNEKGEYIGKIETREKCHKEGLWHKAVVVFIINSKGQVLLQKRSANKRMWPNTWDVTAGGHVLAGEFGFQSILRECKEELGIELNKNDITFIGAGISNNIKGDIVNNHFNEYYVANKEVDETRLKLQEEEVSEVKWIDKDEIIGKIKGNYNGITDKEGCWEYLIKYYEWLEKNNWREYGNNCNISTQSYIGKTITAKIDRQMGSKHPKYGFVYPINYGYIPNTISGDGEELDCYILGVFEPIESFTGECIAIIHRLNDNDDKLVLVPENKKYSNGEIRALTEFQERFFESMIIN